MDIRGFQVWLSAARGLTRAQRREALAVLSGRSEGEASKAAIELGVDEARRNLSTTLRHRRLRFTEQSLLLWMCQVD